MRSACNYIVDGCGMEPGHAVSEQHPGDDRGYTAHGPRSQATWNARRWVPRIPIDHVVVSPEVKVIARRVGPDVGSDHLPIEATLAIP